ncbi:hypothetical protein [Streptomyces sp. NBU3104]|nr:hypothetical protein [Streptomyces sp. NBU3104]UKL04192.1 hypothetical protein L2I08_15335 [Streptomyces sp. NBU3104]
MADTQHRPPADTPPAGPADITGILASRLGQRRTAPAAPAAPAAAPAPDKVPASAAADPGAVPRLAGLPGQIPVGWEVIEDLQAVVSKTLSAEDPDKLLAEEDRRALARRLVRNAVAEWSAKYAQGNAGLTQEQEAAIGTAVFDSMYRGGRL